MSYVSKPFIRRRKNSNEKLQKYLVRSLQSIGENICLISFEVQASVVYILGEGLRK
jgi:hypothetical protein